MVRPSLSKKPKLKLKAAEGRRLLPVLREALATCFEITSPHQILRLHCVDSLLECYRTMQEWEERSAPAADLAAAGRRYLLQCRSLRDLSTVSLRLNLYPKHNLLVHLLDGSTANPKDEWNYSDESEIGDAIGLAQKVLAQHMSTALIKRY